MRAPFGPMTRGKRGNGLHAASGVKIFAARAALAGFPLKQDEIEGGSEVPAADRREQTMRLPAVMGLVVEEMVERRRQLLGRRSAGLVMVRKLNVRPSSASPSAPMQWLMRASSCAARGRQRGEVVEQDGIETRGRLALAGEALHPDAVADQEMVERAVHRFEEGAAVGAVLGIGQFARPRLEPLVRPGIVAGEHPVAFGHRLNSRSWLQTIAEPRDSLPALIQIKSLPRPLP